MNIAYVPLADVQKWPTNPKLHDGARLDESLTRFGFVNPLVLDESTGRIVAGHGRLEALTRLQAAGKAAPQRIQVSPEGVWMVPVLRGISFSTEQEAEAFLVADNRLVELGGWDETALSEMLARWDNTADVEGILGFANVSVGVALEGATELPAETVPAAPQTTFALFVTVDTEDAQKALYEELVARGLVCRLSTL